MGTDRYNDKSASAITLDLVKN